MQMCYNNLLKIFDNVNENSRKLDWWWNNEKILWFSEREREAEVGLKWAYQMFGHLKTTSKKRGVEIKKNVNQGLSALKHV